MLPRPFSLQLQVMHTDTMLFTIFLIFSGAAVLSTLVLYTRQSLLVAYIILGALFGPSFLKLIPDPTIVQQIGSAGIIFLLFLLGLNLHPQNLVRMLSKVTLLTLLSSLLFAAIGFGVALFFGFDMVESLFIGAAMMFSSTIIGLKLLPTLTLHHQHTGDLMVSVLLMQDIIAIIVLLLINGMHKGGLTWHDFAVVIIGLPALFAIALLIQRYILVVLIRRFDKTQEYIFLLSIGWCLGLAQLAAYLGLSEEIGAFIAGVSLAASPIARFIAESLKPLRDFFLVMFFFAIGASFDFQFLNVVLLPAAILALMLLAVKPVAFYGLLRASGEEPKTATEVGFRLGQGSEFGLLIASLAVNHALIGHTAVYLIQAATIITFIISSYIVVLRFPTPIALSDKLRRD